MAVYGRQRPAETLVRTAVGARFMVRMCSATRRAGIHAYGRTGERRTSASTEQLASFYQGERVVLLWDWLSSHWSYKMRAHLDKQGAWLQVERLPAYAPELNPVEYLWANLKGAELANYAGDTVAELADQARHGAKRICDSDSLVVGFLAHTGLTLDDVSSPYVKESVRKLKRYIAREIYQHLTSPPALAPAACPK